MAPQRQPVSLVPRLACRARSLTGTSAAWMVEIGRAWISLHRQLAPVHGLGLAWLIWVVGALFFSLMKSDFAFWYLSLPTQSCRCESMLYMPFGRLILNITFGTNPPGSILFSISTSIWPFSSGVSRHVLFRLVTRK